MVNKKRVLSFVIQSTVPRENKVKLLYLFAAPHARFSLAGVRQHRKTGSSQVCQIIRYNVRTFPWCDSWLQMTLTLMSVMSICNQDTKMTCTMLTWWENYEYIGRFARNFSCHIDMIAELVGKLGHDLLFTTRSHVWMKRRYYVNSFVDTAIQPRSQGCMISPRHLFPQCFDQSYAERSKRTARCPWRRGWQQIVSIKLVDKILDVSVLFYDVTIKGTCLIFPSCTPAETGSCREH